MKFLQSLFCIKNILPWITPQICRQIYLTQKKKINFVFSIYSEVRGCAIFHWKLVLPDIVAKILSTLINKGRFYEEKRNNLYRMKSIIIGTDTEHFGEI